MASRVARRMNSRISVIGSGLNQRMSRAYVAVTSTASCCTRERPFTMMQPTSQGGTPMGAEAAISTMLSSTSGETSSSVNWRTLRRPSIRAASESGVALSSSPGAFIRSSGESPRPVTLIAAVGQAIMQWPQAMQPNGLSVLTLKVRPSKASTSAGQAFAQLPHKWQRAGSMLTCPFSEYTL